MPYLRNKRTGETIWVDDGAPRTIGTPDPIKVAGATKAQNEAAASIYEPQTAAADVKLKEAQAENEALKAAAARANAGLPDLTPAARQEAITNLQSALEMSPMIRDLQDRFEEGPGATKGIQGLLDYLPWRQENERFDAAANKFRGSVKRSQGFTGGEGNTAAEAQMNIGAFIPSSRQRDGTIRDNIDALRRERDKAVRSNVAILGGFPDANGKVTQVPTGYFVGQYPALDRSIMRKIGDVTPQNRQAFIIDSKRRYEAAMAKSRKARSSGGIKFLGFED